AAAVFRFAGRIGVKGVATALNRERQLERIADDCGLEALFVVETGGLLLDSHTRPAKAKNDVTAVSLLEVILFSGSLNEVFDLPRRKFNCASTRIANEVQMIRLADHRFVSADPVQLRLPHEAGLQQDLNRTVNCCKANAMSLLQQAVADLLDRW